jgi:TfoX/Sxy family transcriptional regulator of competence genes
MARKRGGKRFLTFRDFPTELYWQCKEQAVRRRMSLKQYVIQALAQVAERDAREQKVKLYVGPESSSSDDD